MRNSPYLDRRPRPEPVAWLHVWTSDGKPWCEQGPAFTDYEEAMDRIMDGYEGLSYRFTIVTYRDGSEEREDLEDAAHRWRRAYDADRRADERHSMSLRAGRENI